MVRERAEEEMEAVRARAAPILKQRSLSDQEQAQTVEEYFAAVEPEFDKEEMTAMARKWVNDYFLENHNKPEYHLGIWGGIKSKTANLIGFGSRELQLQQL